MSLPCAVPGSRAEKEAYFGAPFHLLHRGACARGAVRVDDCFAFDAAVSTGFRRSTASGNVVQGARCKKTKYEIKEQRDAGREVAVWYCSRLSCLSLVKVVDGSRQGETPRGQPSPQGATSSAASSSSEMASKRRRARPDQGRRGASQVRQQQAEEFVVPRRLGSPPLQGSTAADDCKASQRQEDVQVWWCERQSWLDMQLSSLRPLGPASRGGVW